MMRFTQGPPDEMAVWIGLGIVTYLIVFPIVVIAAAVCAEVVHRTRSAGPDAARAPRESSAPGPARQRGVGSPRETGVGTAA